jgi:hypothetical protein
MSRDGDILRKGSSLESVGHVFSFGIGGGFAEYHGDG